MLRNGWQVSPEYAIELKGKKFTNNSVEYKRLMNYARLIEEGVAFKGKRFKKIKVIFSSEEFAKANKEQLLYIFEEDLLEIIFINNKLKEIPLK